MYLQLDINSLCQSAKGYKKDHVLAYLQDVDNNQIITVEDMIVSLRFLSTSALRERCMSLSPRLWIVSQIEDKMVEQGYLLGILFIGIKSHSVELLLQVLHLFQFQFRIMLIVQMMFRPFQSSRYTFAKSLITVFTTSNSKSTVIKWTLAISTCWNMRNSSIIGAL